MFVYLNYMLLLLYVCSGDIRLLQTRLQISYKGQWMTVCDDKFEYHTAVVACRQLALKDNRPWRSGRKIQCKSNRSKQRRQRGRSKEAGSIYIGRVQCRGHEENLMDCRNLKLEAHKCPNSRDVCLECREY